MGNLTLTDLPQDMTKDEKELVLAFISNGCPGLLKVQQSDMFKLFELYMSGKTYAEIATTAKVSKVLVMYLSYKSHWMDLRFKHYEDISLNILDKLQKTKLDIANDLAIAISATGKYLRGEYNRYLSTNDKSIIEGIDQKIVTGHRQNIDALKNVLDEDEGSSSKKPKQPLVNINMGLGSAATVQQTDERTLEITDETAGDLIKALASMKKSAESK